jgi:glucokinase
MECERFPMDRTSQEAALESIWNAVDRYLAHTSHLMPPGIAGLGLVGKVDSERGVWSEAVNIPIGRAVDMSKEFARRYGMKVALSNDVHAAATAELIHGEGRKWKDFVYINAGTGIAAGIVVNGQLLRGANHAAGEIGHMIIGSDERQCKCGQTGCLEVLASGGDLIKHVKVISQAYPASMLQPYIRSGELSAKHIFAAAQSGDTLGQEITAKAITALGQAIINLAVILDTEAFVLGGGLFQDPWFFEQLAAYVQHRRGVFAKAAVRLRLSSLDPTLVGLIGAGSVAWMRYDSA